MAGEIDLVSEYQQYLARFHDAFGELNFGEFVKNQGRLIKKLTYDEFDEAYREYYAVAKDYFAANDRGDTINDIVVRVLREHASELVLPSPI